MTAKKPCLKQILKWSFTLLLLLLVLVLAGTWLVNRGPLQQRVRAAISRQSGDILTFRHLAIVLFPRPSFELSDPAMAVPGKLHMTVKAARIYPELLPLLLGDIRIAKVKLQRPSIVLPLTEERGAVPEDPRAVFEETRTEIESAARQIRRIGPGFSVEVINGKVEVRGPTRVLVKIEQVHGSITLLPKGFSVHLTGKDAGWGGISVKGEVLAGKNSIAVRNLSISGGRSSIAGATARFRWKRTPYLRITSGSAVLFLEEIHERRVWLGLKDRLRNIDTMQGVVAFSQMLFVGPLLHPDKWQFTAAGSLADISFRSSLFRDALRFDTGLFKATSREITFTDLEAGFLGSTATGRLTLAGTPDRIRSVHASVRGRFGKEFVKWSADRFKIRPDLVPRAPFELFHLRVNWRTGSAMDIAGKASFGNGTIVTVNMKKQADRFTINELTVDDERDRAFFSVESTPNLLAFTFRGVLQERSINRILQHPSVHQGSVRGDLSGRLLFDSPRESTIEGSLSGIGLFFLQGQAEPVTIRRLELEAAGRTATIHAASFLWGATPFEVKGRMNGFAEGFQVKLDVRTGSLSLQRIQKLLSHIAAVARSSGKTGRNGPRMVQGRIRAEAKDVELGGYTFAPVKADIFLDRNSLRVQFVESELCGMPVPGHLQPFDRELLLDFRPEVREKPLEPVLACLSSTRRISGTFDLSARLHARGAGEGLLRSLEGNVEFSARNGKVYSYPLLARIFAVLNVTELLRGKLPDLGRDGFAYKTIKIRADIQQGRIVFREALLQGATLNLVAEGSIDLVANRVEMILLVAPFKTLEYLLSRIPLVRNILANRLITVPVRITGDLNDPAIKPLDPKAIGSNLLRIMRSILELPFQVLDPLIGQRG